MKKTIVYGFGPYAKIARNPAQEVIETLQQEAKTTRTTKFELLRVDAQYIQRRLRELLHEESIRRVVGFGVWPGITAIRLEKYALNTIRTSEGLRWPTAPAIMPEGPASYSTRADLRLIENRLRGQGIPAYSSHDPDTYACNLSYYLAHHHTSPSNTEVLFVHLPLTTAGTIDFDCRLASLPREMLVRAAETIVYGEWQTNPTEEDTKNTTAEESSGREAPQTMEGTTD